MAKTLHYNFAADKSLVARIGPTLSITRATSATYIDNAGLIATATTGVARFTHNPTTPFASLGLLIEEARTNICLQSEDFSTTWVNTNTDEPSSVAAPDGATTADEIAATATADQAFAIYQGFTGRTAAEATTISCFLKAGVNATFAQLAYDSNGSGADGFFCNFNLSTGAKGTVTAMTAGTATSSTIEDYGNGWYRCSITGSIAVGTVARMTVAITDIITAAKFEAANLANNDSIYAWGAEINAGTLATFPTSYIATTTASVTRNADYPNTSDLSWYTQTGGTFYTQATFPYQTDGTVLWQLDDGTTNDRIRPAVHTFGQQRGGFTVTIGASNEVSIGFASGIWVVGATERAAYAVVADDAEYYHQGSRAGTGDQTVTMNSDMSVFTVGTSSTAPSVETISGIIAELAYFNTRLDNATLALMSTDGTFPSEEGGAFGAKSNRFYAAGGRISF